MRCWTGSLQTSTCEQAKWSTVKELKSRTL